MKILGYDGSYFGFLCVLKNLVLDNKESLNSIKVVNTRIEPEEQYLFLEKIESNPQHAKEFYNFLSEKLPEEFLKKIYLYYLCDSEHLEVVLSLAILKVLEGKLSIKEISKEEINSLFVAERKLFRERHRYLGIVRFSKISQNLYLSKISPNYNIIPLISQHFVNRFRNQDFLIYDVKRRIVLSYINRTKEILWLDTDLKIKRDDYEFENLWRSYLKHIAIPERQNLRLQKSKLPIYLRKFMVDF